MGKAFLVGFLCSRAKLNWDKGKQNVEKEASVGDGERTKVKLY